MLIRIINILTEMYKFSVFNIKYSRVTNNRVEGWVGRMEGWNNQSFGKIQKINLLNGKRYFIFVK